MAEEQDGKEKNDKELDNKEDLGYSSTGRNVKDSNGTNDTKDDKTDDGDEPDFEEQVKSIIEKATTDDKGNLVFDNTDALKDVDPALAYAAKAELRLRNTQSAYTNSRKELVKQQSINEKLVEKISTNLTVSLTAEDKEKLAKVKNMPEQYHQVRAEIESKARDKLTEELKEIENNANSMSEEEVRKAQLEAFNESSELKITQETVDNELPAAYAKKLKSREWTFTEFLQHSQAFLTKDKTIKESGRGKKENNEKDMKKISGGSTPSDPSTEDINTEYKNTVF